MTTNIRTDNDEWKILATSSRQDEPTLVLKRGSTFALFDRHGDICPNDTGKQGIFHDGARFLSQCELRVYGHRPLLLKSIVRDDNSLLSADLTNPDLYRNGHLGIPHGTLHIFRAKLLWQGVCYERVRHVRSAGHDAPTARYWVGPDRRKPRGGAGPSRPQ